VCISTAVSIPTPTPTAWASQDTHIPVVAAPLLSCSQFDWLCREKIADGPLIAKWRKPGYEILCSMLAIQKGNHNFGTTSHCRVPLRLRAAQVGRGRAYERMCRRGV
jgi:hypothetical protein